MDEKTAMVYRINRLISADSKKKSQILRELQLSTSTLSDWEKGKGNPSSSAVIKLANYFHVSTDYILLGTTTEPPSTGPADPCEQEWISLYRSLSPAEREICTAFLRGVLAEKKLKER